MFPDPIKIQIDFRKEIVHLGLRVSDNYVQNLVMPLYRVTKIFTPSTTQSEWMVDNMYCQFLRKKDYNFVKPISDIFIKNWNNSKYREIAYLKKLKHSFEPVYHPTGMIRIGSSSKNSIVNKNLRLWSIKNCYVCSTSVFPTPGISNTGLTLLALSLRLSNHLKNINKN